MADPEGPKDLIRRLKDVQVRQKALSEDVEQLVRELEGKAVGAPAAAHAEQASASEIAQEEAEHARYAPPVAMKPHEYIFWVVQTIGVIDYEKLCAYMFPDQEDTAAHRKVIRNILSHLRDAGRVVNVGRNVWRVREAGERKN